MEPKWAEENLQTIRTLMERSAVYRRALAPIMIFVGIMGSLGGFGGWIFKINSSAGFLSYWVGIAIVSLTGALLLARRQALKDSEFFWSPPTRRIAQALAPAFLVGLILTIPTLIGSMGDPADEYDVAFQKIPIVIWAWLYGCAIHSAGFFMPKGIRWLGWIFILTGSFLMILGAAAIFGFIPNDWLMFFSPQLLMGLVFGGLHLAYGIYLHLTEQKNPAA